MRLACRCLFGLPQPAGAHAAAASERPGGECGDRATAAQAVAAAVVNTAQSVAPGNRRGRRRAGRPGSPWLPWTPPGRSRPGLDVVWLPMGGGT